MTPSPPLATSAALLHGRAAYGARYLRDGFAVSPEDDLHFALGYPHFRTVVDRPSIEEESDIEAIAAAVITAPLVWTVVPRAIAVRRARVFGALKFDASGNRNAEVVDPLLRNTEPVTPAEAQSLIEAQMANQWVSGLTGYEQIATLEALVGTLPLLETVTNAVEALPPVALTGRGGRALYASWLGFALLRVPVEASLAYRSRLQAVLEKVDFKKPVYCFASELDRALNGAEALRRHHSPFGPAALYVHDAPDVVKAHVLAETIDVTLQPDARLAFLGGDEVIDHYVKHWKKVKDVDYLRAAIEQFGRIRSVKALTFILELSAASKAKKEALAWLVEHAERARPFLETTASGEGDHARWAKAALAKLPRGGHE
jgi:hypothetical protein